MTGREVSRNGRRQWVVFLLACLVAACELTEVAIPASDPIVIVQAILRPDLNRQWVIVERSLTGAEERQSTPGDIPFDRPQLPIVGASVTVERRNIGHTARRMDWPCAVFGAHHQAVCGEQLHGSFASAKVGGSDTHPVTDFDGRWLLRRRVAERYESEDGNENCGVTHGVVLCGNAPRLL